MLGRAVAGSAAADGSAPPNSVRELARPSTDSAECWQPFPSCFATSGCAVADARAVETTLNLPAAIQMLPACSSSARTAPSNTSSARGCRTASPSDSVRRTSTTSICTSTFVAATPDE